MSWYLTVRFDQGYSEFAKTAPLVQFLAAMPELRQTGPVAFESTTGQPWVAVILATCSPTGSYATSGAPVSAVNVVELVCSAYGDPAWYEALAGRIAAFLGWSVFDDQELRQVFARANDTRGTDGA